MKWYFLNISTVLTKAHITSYYTFSKPQLKVLNFNLSLILRRLWCTDKIQNLKSSSL